MSVTQSVHNGATLLDTEKPGWYKHIDLTRLNIHSPDWCILGQVYGDYGHGLDLLPIGSPSNYGFFTFFHTREVEAAWRDEIATRRLKDRVMFGGIQIPVFDVIEPVHV